MFGIYNLKKVHPNFKSQLVSYLSPAEAQLDELLPSTIPAGCFSKTMALGRFDHSVYWFRIWITCMFTLVQKIHSKPCG